MFKILMGVAVSLKEKLRVNPLFSI